jgi:hypothetical protein
MANDGRQSAESAGLAPNACLVTDNKLKSVATSWNLVDADAVRKHFCGVRRTRKLTRRQQRINNEKPHEH